MSFLHREDKQEILARRADLETEGVRVKIQIILQLSLGDNSRLIWLKMQMIFTFLKIFHGIQVTEDMADSQLEGWMRLGKLQEQVTEKYPNVQVRRIVEQPLFIILNLSPILAYLSCFYISKYILKTFPDAPLYGPLDCRRPRGHLGPKVKQTCCLILDILAKKVKVKVILYLV